MSVRIALAASLVALAGLPVAASAAPEPGVLAFEGSGGTTTEWVVGSRLDFDLSRPTLSGGGAYAGVLVEPLGELAGRNTRVGSLQVRAFGDGTGEAVAMLGPDYQLEPGRYRVTLFGQGRVSVRYPLFETQAPGVRVVPRSPTALQFHGRSETLDFGYDAARVELPGAAAAGRRVLQVQLGESAEVGQSQMCVTTGSQCERRLLPVCPPSPAPCAQPPVPPGPLPDVAAGNRPYIVTKLHEPEPRPRTLLWSFEGYRDSPGKLRAAAIVF